MVEVTHLAGRAVCVFHEDDVETIGGMRITDFVGFIQQEFDFDIAPSEGASKSEDQLVFRDGLADLQARKVQIGELRIFNNMVIIQCKRSEFADEVMEQFFQSISRAFGFPTEFPHKKYYISTLSAKFEKDIQNIFNGINKILRIVQGLYDETHYASHDIRLNRISIGGDPTKKFKDDVSRDLIIERRANAPFEENRFFVEAPFSSDKSEMFMKEIEKLI